MSSFYTVLGFRDTAADSLKQSLVKFLKKDAADVGPYKSEEIIKQTSEPEQLCFSEDVLQAGNPGYKKAA